MNKKALVSAVCSFLLWQSFAAAPASAAESAPAHFEAVAGQADVLLAWDAVPGASSYILERDGKAIYQGSERVFVDSALRPAQTSRYSVRASDSPSKSLAQAKVSGWLGEENPTLVNDANGMIFRAAIAYDAGKYYDFLRYATKASALGVPFTANSVFSASKALSQEAFDAYYKGNVDLALRNYTLLLGSPLVTPDFRANAKANFSNMALNRVSESLSSKNYYDAAFFADKLLRYGYPHPSAPSMMAEASVKLSGEAFEAYYAGDDQIVAKDYNLLTSSAGVPDWLVRDSKVNAGFMYPAWAERKLAKTNAFLPLAGAYDAIGLAKKTRYFGADDRNLQIKAAAALSREAFGAYYSGRLEDSVHQYALLSGAYDASELQWAQTTLGRPDLALLTDDAKANLSIIAPRAVAALESQGNLFAAAVYASMAYEAHPFNQQIFSMYWSEVNKLWQNAYQLAVSGKMADSVSSYKLLASLPSITKTVKTDAEANYKMLSK